MFQFKFALSRYLICYIIAISQRFNLFCCVKTKTFLSDWNSETNGRRLIRYLDNRIYDLGLNICK